jgi:hypothetical protein
LAAEELHFVEQEDDAGFVLGGRLAERDENCPLSASVGASAFWGPCVNSRSISAPIWLRCASRYFHSCA